MQSPFWTSQPIGLRAKRSQLSLVSAASLYNAFVSRGMSPLYLHYLTQPVFRFSFRFLRGFQLARLAQCGRFLCPFKCLLLGLLRWHFGALGNFYADQLSRTRGVLLIKA